MLFERSRHRLITWLSKASLRERYLYAAGAAFGVGICIEIFMLKTGFYAAQSRIAARRYHEFEANKKNISEVIDDLKAERFAAELARRQRIFGSKDVPEMTEEELKNVPSLFDWAKDTIYPSEKGWGRYAPDGSLKDQ